MSISVLIAVKLDQEMSYLLLVVVVVTGLSSLVIYARILDVNYVIFGRTFFSYLPPPLSSRKEYEPIHLCSGGIFNV